MIPDRHKSAEKPKILAAEEQITAAVDNLELAAHNLKNTRYDNYFYRINDLLEMIKEIRGTIRHV